MQAAAGHSRLWPPQRALQKSAPANSSHSPSKSWLIAMSMVRIRDARVV